MANGGIIGPPNTICVTYGPRTTTATATQCLPVYKTCNANILVVAGGGAGGYGNSGGGGAGGYRFCTTYPVVCGVTYKVTVGAGGSAPTAPAPYACLGSGTDSSFNTCGVGSAAAFTSTGGGAGQGGSAMGMPGGSGGGSGSHPGVTCTSAGNSPPTSPSQGNPGSNSLGGGVPYNVGGGGGGIGGAGTLPPGDGRHGGLGGAGSSASPVDSTLRAGGGGGAYNWSGGPCTFGERPGGAGGSGGGGNGGYNYTGSGPAAFPGTINLGGGGGGGSPTVANSTPGPAPGRPRKGGDGGSGTVIIIEACGCKTVTGSGIWTQQEQYENKVAGTWS